LGQDSIQCVRLLVVCLVNGRTIADHHVVNLGRTHRGWVEPGPEQRITGETGLGGPARGQLGTLGVVQKLGSPNK
jgi:hypothetical protein